MVAIRRSSHFPRSYISLRDLFSACVIPRCRNANAFWTGSAVSSWQHLSRSPNLVNHLFYHTCHDASCATHDICPPFRVTLPNNAIIPVRTDRKLVFRQLNRWMVSVKPSTANDYSRIFRARYPQARGWPVTPGDNRCQIMCGDAHQSCARGGICRMTWAYMLSTEINLYRAFRKYQNIITSADWPRGLFFAPVLHRRCWWRRPQ
ncbi:hypothetical protein C8R44DRAFT_760564 [Mycena epipterygia]|nr:hypothetical protein C8R44DRAFT_760564 [Mycena epipterygia]